MYITRYNHKGKSMLATKKIYNEALTMDPIDKIKLVDELLGSLDIPNSEIAEEWTLEAKSRVSAYNAGEIKTVSMDEVFEKYKG